MGLTEGVSNMKHGHGIRRSPLTAVLLAGCCVLAADGGDALAVEEVSFNYDVLPILQSRCVSCHSPGGDGYAKTGLDLSSYQGLMRGTRHGPIVVPGDPLTSNLNVLIEGRASPEIRMPHGQRALLHNQTQTIRDWVKQGAPNN
jgi:hypothetical protein